MEKKRLLKNNVAELEVKETNKTYEEAVKKELERFIAFISKKSSDKQKSERESGNTE